MNEDILKALVAVGVQKGKEVLADSLSAKGIPQPIVSFMVDKAEDAVQAIAKAMLDALEPDHVVLRSTGNGEATVDWGS